MRLRSAIFVMLFIMLTGAIAEPSLPSAAGLDAASAVNAMHEAVMRDVIDSEYRFSQPAGGDSIFVLYTDEIAENYLMVSLTGEGRADMAVIQCYELAEFFRNGLDSLTALAMPFIPEDNFEVFEKWRDDTANEIRAATVAGTDVDITYYTGEYIACAMSLSHQDGAENDMLFTALVSWHAPLSADDVTLIMEAGEDGETEADGE